MTNSVTTLEKVIDYASESIFSKLNALERDLGERPFMGRRLTDQERLNEYKELRAEPYSLLNKMEEVRLEIEAYLGDMSPEEREAEGLSDEDVRKVAVSTVLKYVSDMLKISEKLNDPVVGSAPMPPPPDPTLIGEETWQNPGLMSPTTMTPPLPLQSPLPLPPLAEMPPVPPEQAMPLPPLEPPPAGTFPL